MKTPALTLAFLVLTLAGCGGAPAREPANQASIMGQTGPAFPLRAGRVVDRANLLSSEDERRLTQRLAAVEHEIGPQFVIVTVESLQGASILDYGVGLARAWRIGDRARNDGVLLIVAPNERMVRIEVGYGLERRITDPFAARVIRERIAPRLRRGDYPAGIIAGSDAIIARLRSRQTNREIAAQDHLVI